MKIKNLIFPHAPGLVETRLQSKPHKDDPVVERTTQNNAIIMSAFDFMCPLQTHKGKGYNRNKLKAYDTHL